MTKKKGIASKLFLLVVLLTLISCCFLGSTFARYISTESGNATMQVAKWSIDVANEEDGDVTTAVFDKLSPAMEAYDNGDNDDQYNEGSVRSNKTNKVLVATITNTGDVDARVSFTISEQPTLTQGEGAEDFGAGTYTLETIQGLFSIALYTNTTDDAEGATAYTPGETEAINVAATSGTLYVYAEVTWTSDDSTVFGNAADERDTWVGQNVESVAYALTYTAVQSSERPDA